MSQSNKIDTSSFKIIRSTKDLEEETIYWLDKTPAERLEAIEFLRQQYIKLQNLPTSIDKTHFAINYGKQVG